MKTLSGKVLVSPYDWKEKRRYRLSQEVEIEIENKFNKNLRERNPQTAIVEAISDGCTQLRVGEVILVHHFTFCDHNGDEADGLYVNGTKYWMVDEDECFLVIGEKGVERMLNRYILCEQQYVTVQELESGIVAPESIQKRKLRGKLKVVMLPVDSDLTLNTGDVIQADPKTPYALKVHGVEYMRIREDNVLFKYKDKTSENEFPFDLAIIKHGEEKSS